MNDDNKTPKADAEHTAASASSDQAAPPQAAKKKRSRRAPIAVAVVVAIVAVAGAGMWVWHEQPSFCNAFCHVSMDPYLPTYEAEPGQPALDKWGNEVSDASAMMAAVHRAEEGDTCMSCHVPTIGEQVSEFGSWVGGTYDVVSVGSAVQQGDMSYALIERSLDELVAARGLSSGDGFCLNESCHNLTKKELAEKTADLPRNPHVNQHDNINSCGDCHKAHRASVMQCAKCHADAEVPEGWLTPGQADDLEFVAN